MATIKKWWRSFPPEEEPPMRRKRDRTWAGQGFCERCGSELKHEDVFPENAYHPFTGEKKEKLGEVIFCPHAVTDLMSPAAYLGRIVTPKMLFEGTDEDLRHDHWTHK